MGSVRDGAFQAGGGAVQATVSDSRISFYDRAVFVAYIDPVEPEYRNISKQPGSSFEVSYLDEPAFPAAWHFHPQFELTYVLGSTGTRYVGDRVETFGPGDLVLLGANLPHSWRTVGRQTERVRCVVVRWDNEVLADWLDRPELAGISRLLRLAQRGLRFPTELATALAPDLLALREQPPFPRLLTLLRVLERLSRAPATQLASPGFEHHRSPDQRERVSLLYAYLQRHYDRPIPLAETAAELSLSREAFSRFCRRHLGRTFTALVNQYRTNVACRLLTDSELTVTEIAYRVGYSTPSFFYRQFRKFTGLTPRAYRRAYQLLG